MKPKNKLQRKILKLSQSLPPLNEYQRKRAIAKAGLHIAKYNSKKQYVCLDCGHSWTGEAESKVVCPHCSTKLKVDKGRKWNYCDKSYIAVVTKCKGFQVIRMFFMQTNLRRGEAATHWICEAFQRWLSPDGTCTIVGRARHWLAHYCDSWNWESVMEIRTEGYAHSVTPWKIIGHSSVIPEIRRNGYNGNFHKCSPYTLFRKLLTDNKIETAWKVGQYKLIAHSMGNSYIFEKYWPSIKIAIRHNYIISDPSIWYDLLDVLQYFGKDIRNPKFICPENLKAVHDYWVAKKRAKQEEAERRRLQERYLANSEQDEAQYKKAKSKFLNLEFVDREIVIKPLQSVKEFMEEGISMHHCVFTNKYYTKKNMLIMHALVKGVSIATIEFSLENFSIVQCRGKCNTIPVNYKRITSLINSNIPKIISKIA